MRCQVCYWYIKCFHVIISVVYVCLRVCRQEIEDSICNLIHKHHSQDKHTSASQIKPQNSALFLDQDQQVKSSSAIKTVTEAFKVIGSVLYFTTFSVDKLGQPLLDENPQLTDGWEVPTYMQVFNQVIGTDGQEVEMKDRRPKSMCFNCGSPAHQIRDCPKPKDQAAINERRKEFSQNQSPSVGNQRYHAEVEERFSKYKAGFMSEELLSALGVGANTLPPLIYRMRQLGYPPGWLKEAEVEKSGLALYDGKGEGLANNNSYHFHSVFSSEPGTPHRSQGPGGFQFQSPLPPGSPSFGSPPPLPHGTPPATPTPPPLPKGTPPPTPTNGSPALPGRAWVVVDEAGEGAEDGLTLEELEEQQRLIWAALENADTATNSDCDTQLTGPSVPSSPSVSVRAPVDGPLSLGPIGGQTDAPLSPKPDNNLSPDRVQGVDQNPSLDASSVEKVPHRSRFAAGIVPFEDTPEYTEVATATGTYLRIRDVLKCSPRNVSRRSK
uniref:Zinc finger CCHC domain-containing protein 8 n=1 Tax=Gadus morhua TaxID=8049 RepID=A0A8C4ZLU2_GADMO